MNFECVQCGAPIMTRAQELDRISVLAEARRDLPGWIRRAAVRIEQLTTERRLGREGRFLCLACQAVYQSIADKAYWQGVQAESLRAKNRCLNGGE